MGFPSFGKKIVTGIKTAAHATGHVVSTVVHKAAGVAQTVGTKIGHGVSDIAKTGEKAVSTVYHDVINYPKTLTDSAANLIGAGRNALSKLGGSLMIPLTVVGGVAAFALLNK